MKSHRQTIPLVALAVSIAIAWWAVSASETYEVGFQPFIILIMLAFAGVPALAGAGVWFVCRWLARKLRLDADSRRTPQIFPAVPIRNVLPYKPQKLAPVTVNLPNFGQYCGFVFNIVMFTLIILQTPRVPTGFMISMTQRDPGAGLNSPQTETLGVYVAQGGIFVVNGEAVTRDQLREKLRQELAKRIGSIVYVEGNDDVEYARVVFVFDTIKGLGAEPYWITPHLRNEWNEQQRH